MWKKECDNCRFIEECRFKEYEEPITNIVYTTDIHNYYDKYNFDDIRRVKEELNAIAIDCGDTFTHSKNKGEDVYEKLKGIYDVQIIGNHDVDNKNKLEDWYARGIPFISCNLFRKGTNELVFPPYKIIGDIAFIGTSSTIADKNYTTVKGAGLYEQVQKYIDELKGYKICVVTHANHNKIIQNTRGIDFCLTGHLHQAIEKDYYKDKDGKKVPYSMAYLHFKCYGIGKIGQDIDFKLIK